VVSVFDDAYSTILTLECDHRFGMDVIGDPQKILSFRYVCSAAINPIEHWVIQTLFPGDDGRSITIGLGQMILNGELVDMLMSNGYLVMKSEDNTLFLVFDPETGILRDVMIVYIPISGAYCFSDLQTEWIVDQAEEVLNKGMNLPWLGMVGSISLGASSVLGAGTGITGLAATLFSNPVGWVISLGIAAVAIDAYLIWEYPDIMIPVNLEAIPVIGPLLSIYSLQAVLQG